MATIYWILIGSGLIILSLAISCIGMPVNEPQFLAVQRLGKFIKIIFPGSIFLKALFIDKVIKNFSKKPHLIDLFPSEKGKNKKEKKEETFQAKDGTDVIPRASLRYYINVEENNSNSENVKNFSIYYKHVADIPELIRDAMINRLKIILDFLTLEEAIINEQTLSVDLELFLREDSNTQRELSIITKINGKKTTRIASVPTGRINYEKEYGIKVKEVNVQEIEPADKTIFEQRDKLKQIEYETRIEEANMAKEERKALWKKKVEIIEKEAIGQGERRKWEEIGAAMGITREAYPDDREFERKMFSVIDKFNERDLAQNPGAKWILGGSSLGESLMGMFTGKQASQQRHQLSPPQDSPTPQQQPKPRKKTLTIKKRPSKPKDSGNDGNKGGQA